jgi:hypothetical protein
MMRFKRILVFSIVALLLLMQSSALVAQGPYSILTGVVRGIHVHVLRKWLEVESDKDKAVVELRIGRDTRYSPRLPSVGEKVKVEYLTNRGVPVAYSVTILEEAKRSPKEAPKKSPQ